MTLTLVALPLLLLLAGFPIFVVLLTASVFTLSFHMTIPMAAVPQNLFGSLNASGLLAIPYFIFAGDLMARGTVSARLVGFVKSYAGALPGALGVTTVGTATVFGAISGSSAAAVASVGKVMQPSLHSAGYPEKTTAGLITSVSAIGIIIPPSIPMIVYGAASETSIPRLYAAGVLPGLLLAISLAAYVIWRAHSEGYGKGQPVTVRDILHNSRRAIWALGAPVIVLGGIYGGVFSPTEAAAVACLYSMLVTRFILQELSWNDILSSARNTVVFTTQILLIVSAAGLFSWILTVNQVPQIFVAWIEQNNVQPWQFLLAVNVLLLIWGCVMEPMSAILLLTPVLVPLVHTLGIDPVHFGIIMTLNLAIGLFTPPFGINIFVAQSALGMRTGDIYKGVWPFFAVFLLVLAMVTYIPEIALTSAEWLFVGG